MRVLGIDPSLSSTGLVVFDARRFRLVAKSTVKTKAKAERHERLAAITAAISRLTSRPGFDAVAFEAGFVGPGRQASLYVAEARGAALSAAWIYGGGALCSIPPRSAKKHVTGNGAATKDEVAAKLAELVDGADDLTEDEADALAVAVTAAAMLMDPAATTVAKKKTRRASK